MGVNVWPNGGGAVWGGITGTLSDQTDLQNALDAKVNTTRTIVTTGTSPTPTANDSGKQYHLTAGAGSFPLPASAGCVEGQTVFYITPEGISPSVTPNGVDTLRGIASDMIPFTGENEVVVLDGGSVEVRYEGSGVWLMSGWAMGIP